MSKIIACDNVNTNTWNVSLEDIAPNYADLQIGCSDGSKCTEYSNLRFGFELRKDGEVVQEKSWPPKNVRYIRSDQSCLVTHRIKYDSDTTYEFFLWAENANQRAEHTFEFVTPMPPQPYPSWTWDGSDWIAPVAHPDNGKFYVWNEEQQNWEEWNGEVE